MMIWPTDKTGQEDNFYVNFLHLEKKDDDETLSQQVEASFGTNKGVHI